MGPLSKIDQEFARDAHNYMTDPSMIATQFRRFAHGALRADPGRLD